MGRAILTRKRKLVRGPERLVDYYVIPQGRIGETDLQARLDGIWEVFEGRLYITCLGCGAINDISHQEVNPDGFVVDPGHTLGCVVCQKCGTHNFFKLEGWVPVENEGR